MVTVVSDMRFQFQISRNTFNRGGAKTYKWFAVAKFVKNISL